MSKENAIKFLEFMVKNPEIVQEGKKYNDGKTDINVIASKLAKDKGFDCTAKEIEEVMEMAKKNGSEMSEDDLENVAGGGFSAEKLHQLGGQMGGILGDLMQFGANTYNILKYDQKAGE